MLFIKMIEFEVENPDILFSSEVKLKSFFTALNLSLMSSKI